MAATIPNIAKGRVNEFARRVDTGDPANSRLIIVLLSAAETIAVLRDYDDLAALLAAAGNTESALASYTRQVLAAADITLPTVDDTNDLQSFDTADVSFGALETGETIVASVVCFIPDGVTPGADSTAVPIHITVPASGTATNGEVFNWRTPNGLWQATE